MKWFLSIQLWKVSSSWNSLSKQTKTKLMVEGLGSWRALAFMKPCYLSFKLYRKNISKISILIRLSNFPLKYCNYQTLSTIGNALNETSTSWINNYVSNTYSKICILLIYVKFFLIDIKINITSKLLIQNCILIINLLKLCLL